MLVGLRAACLASCTPGHEPLALPSASCTAASSQPLLPIPSVANARSHISKANDWRRTARFGVIGLTLHGPYFLHGFRALDQRFGLAQDLKTVSFPT